MREWMIVVEGLQEQDEDALDLQPSSFILKNGQKLIVKAMESFDDGLHVLEIFAAIGGDVIGDGKYDMETGQFRGIEVDKEYRRLGIATAIYGYVEALGLDVIPSPHLQPDGERFWQDRNQKITESDDIDSIGEIVVQWPHSDWTPKIKDMKEFQLATVWQSLRRKRSAAAKELLRKIEIYGRHLASERQRAEEEREVSWIDRLDNVVSKQGDYAITVDSLDDAAFVILWFSGKRVGKISTRTHMIDGEKYLGIGSAEIEPKHRGKGFGKGMYMALLKHTKTAGIASYLPDRSNKKQVPKIYKALGGYLRDDDFAIIPKKINETIKSIFEAKGGPNERVWFNAKTGEVVPVMVDHIDTVYDQSEMFGFTDNDLSDLEDEEDGVMLATIQKGWVRINADASVTTYPYVMAHTIMDARKAARWLVKRVDLHIVNLEIFSEKHQQFRLHHGDLHTFLNRGILPRVI
jgi:GNAT superfamily N-acetyltransferase